MKPRYEHDCTHCVFVGRYKEYDLYVHPSEKYNTVVARYSSEGGEYSSGINSRQPELVEAQRRGYARGLCEASPVATPLDSRPKVG
jgi:hypothetical protein